MFNILQTRKSDLHTSKLALHRVALESCEQIENKFDTSIYLICIQWPTNAHISIERESTALILLDALLVPSHAY